MRLGITTYTFMWAIGFEGARPAQPLTPLGLLEKARALGVYVVQVGPNLPLDRLPPDELQAFVRRAHALGIGLELGTRGLEPEHIARQAALSRRLGSTLLRTVPELGGQTPAIEDLIQAVRASLPVLEREGVRLGLENGKLPAEELRAALDALDSQWVGVVLDTVNSLAVAEGYKQVAQVLAPYTICLHYKDFAIRRVWHMMGFICEGRPAGQGQVDAAWLFRTLRAARRDFNVILELWPPEQESLEETIVLEARWAEESIPFLRRFVAE